MNSTDSWIARSVSMPPCRIGVAGRAPAHWTENALPRAPSRRRQNPAYTSYRRQRIDSHLLYCSGGEFARGMLQREVEAVSYLLFDHDGVLVETEYWYFKATQRAIATLGVPMSFDDYKQHLVDGSPAWDLASAAGCSEGQILAAKTDRDEQYQEYLRTEAIDIPGAEEALAKLAESFRMAIVTTSKRDDFELIHKDRNIVPHMEFVLCHGDYSRAKPHPDPYLTALARFGAKKSEALVIEDSARGLRSAVAAGIRCITVHNDFTAHQDLSAADHRVANLAELEIFLRGI